MSRVNHRHLWIAVALLSLLAAACSPLSDDPTPPVEVAAPTVTNIETATPTVTSTARSTPTATASPSSTATPEPYPGITLPFPADDGCDVTSMSGWRNVAGFPGFWLDGDGLTAGTQDGLLYEGENNIAWIAAGDGDIRITVRAIGETAPATDEDVQVVVSDSETPFRSSYIQFETAGCWQISAEQGSSSVEATVAVYPAACRPESFDLVRCPVPPYSLYWNQPRSVPADCDVMAVASLMTGFIDAVNRGDVEEALALFPERKQDTDIDTTGLQWYSIEKMVAENPVELRSLLATLIDEGEQLRLLHLGVFWDWHGGATFHVVMTRETDELGRYRIEGKAAVNCELGHLYLFSAGRQP